MAAKPKKPAPKPAPRKAAAKPAARVMPRKPVSDASHKVDLFKQAYLANGGNKTKAAITAGYSEKTAGQAGHRLFKKVEKEIQAAQTEVINKMGLSLERTLQEIARVAYADPRKLFHADGSLKKIHELDDDTAATVASIEVESLTLDKVAIGTTTKLKAWDKNVALEKAMKFHGAYEKDNKQRVPVVFQVTPTDEAL